MFLLAVGCRFDKRRGSLWLELCCAWNCALYSMHRRIFFAGGGHSWHPPNHSQSRYVSWPNFQAVRTRSGYGQRRPTRLHLQGWGPSSKEPFSDQWNHLHVPFHPVCLSTVPLMNESHLKDTFPECDYKPINVVQEERIQRFHGIYYVSIPSL